MAKFKYAGLDGGGAKVSGAIEAVTFVRAQHELAQRGFHGLEVTERKSIGQFEITAKKIKASDVMTFSRQLAAFLRAGIPILDALDSLDDESANPLLRKVLANVADTLRAGAPFSDTLAAHSSLFPSYYLGIIRSAELTGHLDIVLDQLAEYIERDLEAKRAVKSALTYPAVILVMSFVTVLVLVVWVLPKFRTFFDGLHAKLPLPTRMLLGGADLVSSWWMVIVGAFVVMATVLLVAVRMEWGRTLRDRMLLRSPVIGQIVRCAVVERFCRILGSMLRAGVPVPEAVGSATDATNNRVYIRGLRAAREAILGGEGLAGPIAATQLFPRSAAQMIKVGEASGTLGEQLDVTADFFRSELSYRLKKVTTLFEPAVILGMGLIVGFVAVALISAMYGIFNQSGVG